MRNPVFSRSDEFKTASVTPRGPVPYAQTSGAYGQYGPGYHDPSGAAQLNAMYAQPAAGPLQTGRITYDDVLVKSFSLFAVILVGATVGWMIAPAHTNIIWLGCIVGLVLGLVNIFKREPSPALIILYGVFEGLAVGGISAIYERIWPGLVMQAVIASLSVMGVTLALFASGKVRVSRRANRILLVAMFGYLLFSLVNLVLMWTGVTGDVFGLRTEVKVLGVPLGVILGVLVVIMAAYSFVVDFDEIRNAVQNGAPAKVAWRCAFGLMVTLIWLYLEILRLLAILRNN
ncbi:MAG: Bax inhibitor-1/YccA family protein [Bifidobacteriaceae bacterium]|jgi:uncharacterized YccA/Bax inhibitor family protein|nr:Bax inhibitor-1/YccA family protein [Bifidobacteriaceae bacterium]